MTPPRFVPRHLSGPILRTLRHFPVAGITGARQVGKSTLAQSLISDEWPAVYMTLDDRAALQATVTRTDMDVDLPLLAPESWKVGVQVTWNLFDGGAASAAVREAEEAVTQAELTLQQLEAAMTLELAQHQTALTQALLKLAASERSAAEAAGRYERIRRQADEGAATKLQVWDAEAAWAQARLEQVRALAEVARARTRLAIAAGYDAAHLQQLITARAPGGM